MAGAGRNTFWMYPVSYTHLSHVIEYSLKLDSNPEFTSSVIVAYARAAYRMSQEGQKGCKTVFDVAPDVYKRQVHAHDSVWYQKIKNTIMAECML